jgi:hypothetical protein
MNNSKFVFEGSALHRAVYSICIIAGTLLLLAVISVGCRSCERDKPDDGVQEAGTVTAWVFGWERIRLCRIDGPSYGGRWECGYPVLIPDDIHYQEAINFGVNWERDNLYRHGEHLFGAATLRPHPKMPSQRRLDVLMIRFIPVWIELIVGIFALVFGFFLRAVYLHPEDFPDR